MVQTTDSGTRARSGRWARCAAIASAAALALTLSCSSGAERKRVTHTGRGVVVAIDTAKPRVKINHEKIEGFMDAMTMWFNVKDASLLNGIAVDDHVEFTITEDQAADVVTAIRKVS